MCFEYNNNVVTMNIYIYIYIYYSDTILMDFCLFRRSGIVEKQERNKWMYAQAKWNAAATYCRRF